MEHASLLVNCVIFLAAAAVTWVAGVSLTKTTDSLDTRFNLGDAFGGLVLLGIAGSLPELAVVYSAARESHIPVIIGTLLGGIALQTGLLVIFDLATGKKPLSYLTGSIELSLETVFAIVITVITVLAAAMPARYSVWNVHPLSVAILVAWVVGLFLLNKVRKNPRFSLSAEDANVGRKHLSVCCLHSCSCLLRGG